MNINSVIVFGKVELLKNQDRAIEISRKLSYKFTLDEQYIEDEIRKSGKSVLVFKLIPEHITGKTVNEK